MMLDVRDTAVTDRRLQAMLTHHEVETFNAAYAAALDEQRLTDWVEMFTDDAFYVVISRENADRGMPVGLIYCENKGMIFDRAFALEKTAMFAPRYLRHIIGNLQILGEDSGEIRARANYVVVQVLFDRPDAKLHQVGVYYDRFRRVGDELKLAERRCVYDNLLVDNALCIPVCGVAMRLAPLLRLRGRVGRGHGLPPQPWRMITAPAGATRARPSGSRSTASKRGGRT
jgi:anthranilate 1,2-dioxygenase small subunit